jgi:hypothetical protein
MFTAILAQINSNLGGIKENDDIVIYTTGGHTFKGKFKKMHKTNLGVSLVVLAKDGERQAIIDMEVSAEKIDAIGKIRLPDTIEVVPDSAINLDIKKSSEKVLQEKIVKETIKNEKQDDQQNTK